jgi:hypothetical protein
MTGTEQESESSRYRVEKLIFRNPFGSQQNWWHQPLAKPFFRLHTPMSSFHQSLSPNSTREKLLIADKVEFIFTFFTYLVLLFQLLGLCKSK